ncbi:hypothetical protein K3495_g4799 [Podosphaera aphanis]|nr:hypothetical protein K3495_g4799 [Podosphaera aphanis]
MEYIEVVSEFAKSQNGSKSHHNSPSHHSRCFSPTVHRRSSSAGLRSVFGIGEPKQSKRHSSSLFGGHSSSYYRRSSRKSYMTRMYKKLRRLFRDLAHYVKRHPLKVFMLVILPLITSGALAALLAKFGIRLPTSLQKALSKHGRSSFGKAGSGSWVKKIRKLFGGLGAMGNVMGLVKLLK